MAAGDVEVRIVNATTANIDTALTAMRITGSATGKYLMTSLNSIPAQVCLVGITEA